VFSEWIQNFKAYISASHPYSSFNLLVFVKYLQLLRICTIERFIEDGWFGVQLVVLLVLMSLVRE